MAGNIHSLLEIRDLVLPVHLGQSQKERAKPQDVAFDVILGWSHPLAEENTDILTDSVCYFALCKQIREVCAQKAPFALIEKLANTVLQHLKKTLKPGVKIRLSVHKTKPPIPDLKGGVRYICGDLFLSALAK